MVVLGPSGGVGSAYAIAAVPHIATTSATVTVGALYISPIPHGHVVWWVVGAMVRFLSGNALIVEEDLRPVRPGGRHRIGEMRHHLFGVGAPIGGAKRVKVVRVVDGGLLNLRRLVVLVNDVSLVVDGRVIPCSGKDLLGRAGRDNHAVRDGIVVGGVGCCVSGQQHRPECTCEKDDSGS